MREQRGVDHDEAGMLTDIDLAEVHQPDDEPCIGDGGQASGQLAGNGDPFGFVSPCFGFSSLKSSRGGGI